MFRLVDDGGDPARALAATRRPVESDGVFAIFGTVGTASGLTVRPYLSGANVPHLFAASGASALGVAADAAGRGRWPEGAVSIGWAEDPAGIVVRRGAADRFPIEQAVLRRWSGNRWRSVGGVWRHRGR